MFLGVLRVRLRLECAISLGITDSAPEVTVTGFENLKKDLGYFCWTKVLYRVLSWLCSLLKWSYTVDG